MRKRVEIPKWYPLDVYSKTLTPEEWLFEIWKRNELQKNLQEAIRQGVAMDNFSFVLLENKMPNVSTLLRPERHLPIKPMSVFDVLRLGRALARSNWYQTHHHKHVIDKILSAIESGRNFQSAKVSAEELRILEEFSNTPWYVVDENSTQKDWYPSLSHTHGTPISIDLYFDRKEIISEMRKYLGSIKGMPKKLRPLSKDIFDSWNRKQILAIFDLQTWFRINDIHCPNTELFRIIWPEGSEPESKKEKDITVDPKIFINEAIKITKKAINPATVKTLIQLCESRKWQQTTKKSTK